MDSRFDIAEITCLGSEKSRIIHVSAIGHHRATCFCSYHPFETTLRDVPNRSQSWRTQSDQPGVYGRYIRSLFTVFKCFLNGF